MVTCAPDVRLAPPEPDPPVVLGPDAIAGRRAHVCEQARECIVRTDEECDEMDCGPGVVPWRVRHVEHGW